MTDEPVVVSLMRLFRWQGGTVSDKGDKLMASEQARSIAANFWRDPRTSKTEMDVVLAEVIAEKIDQYLEALIWCGGSADFGPGGQAEKGWNRCVLPLLKEGRQNALREKTDALD